MPLSYSLNPPQAPAKRGRLSREGIFPRFTFLLKEPGIPGGSVVPLSLFLVVNRQGNNFCFQIFISYPDEYFSIRFPEAFRQISHPDTLLHHWRHGPGGHLADIFPFCITTS